MKKISKNHSLKLSVVISFLLGIATGVGYNEISTTTSWHSFHTETDNLNICFTPPSGCGSLIAKEISNPHIA